MFAHNCYKFIFAGIGLSKKKMQIKTTCIKMLALAYWIVCQEINFMIKDVTISLYECMLTEASCKVGVSYGSQVLRVLKERHIGRRKRLRSISVSV